MKAMNHTNKEVRMLKGHQSKLSIKQNSYQRKIIYNYSLKYLL